MRFSPRTIPSIYGAFLRGLFEADGTVVNGAAHLSTANASLADDVRTVLLTLGIPTNTRIDKSGWSGADLYVLRVRNADYVRNFLRRSDSSVTVSAAPCARATLGRAPKATASSCAKTFCARSFRIPASSIRGPRFTATVMPARSAARRRPSCSNEPAALRYKTALTFFYDDVAANDDGGEQLTYDLSVPANVTYFANGFISHNTIGLVMDCDTTGIEPDFALVKFKKLAGGGYFKIVNQSVDAALHKLGYSQEQIERSRLRQRHRTLEEAPHINRATLKAKGLRRRGDRAASKLRFRAPSSCRSSSTSSCSAKSSAKNSSA